MGVGAEVRGEGSPGWYSTNIAAADTSASDTAETAGRRSRTSPRKTSGQTR